MMKPMKLILLLAAAVLSSSCVVRDARGPVAVGMSRAQARAAWGAPVKVNRSNTHCCLIEQWRYQEGYLVFENNQLASWKYRE